MKPTLERAARALCRHEGHPENIQFEGRPMWESYLPQARAVLEAITEPDMAMVSAAADKAKQIGGRGFRRDIQGDDRGGDRGVILPVHFSVDMRN